jgi:hypothetical protein
MLPKRSDLHELRRGLIRADFVKNRECHAQRGDGSADKASMRISDLNGSEYRRSSRFSLWRSKALAFRATAPGKSIDRHLLLHDKLLEHPYDPRGVVIDRPISPDFSCSKSFFNSQVGLLHLAKLVAPLDRDRPFLCRPRVRPFA